MKVSSLVKMDFEMHNCLRGTVRVSRWAGIFPCEGLNKTDIGELRFNMKSFYALYCLLTVVLQIITTGLIVYWFFSNRLSLETLSSLVFQTSVLSSAILLLKLAREWPRLIRSAASIERCVAALRVTKTRAVKFNTMTYVVLILAAIEHILSLIHRAKNMLLNQGVEYNSRDFIFETNYCRMFSNKFNYLPCNLFTIGLHNLANFQAAFLWNFTDVISMSFSMYLMSYFRDFNNLVNSERDMKIQNWEQLRIYYSKLVSLVQVVDSKMCYLILLSILTNLFYICLQLYYTLNSALILTMHGQKLLQQEERNIDRVINLFYFTYSFSFLVVRSMVMLFLAANINTAAMQPKYTLGYVSHIYYNIHVQRFNRQLRYTTTALSGVFFYVTRAMILKSLTWLFVMSYLCVSTPPATQGILVRGVFATIVTYELVLLQFNK